MLPTSYRDAKDTLNMIADYYPEYLGYVLLQETPLLVRLFIHLVWPFVDAHTKQRVQIGGGQAAIAAGDFEPHMLIKECGGGLDVSTDCDCWLTATSCRTTLKNTGPHCLPSAKSDGRFIYKTGGPWAILLLVVQSVFSSCRTPSARNRRLESNLRPPTRPLKRTQCWLSSLAPP